MSESTVSRIARKYRAVAIEVAQRHGTIEVARTCMLRDGKRCELCNRVMPDHRKRQWNKRRSERTNACSHGGLKEHRNCSGWRFAPGNSTFNRGAAPCECDCHKDGRGRAVPPLEAFLAERAAAEAARQEWRAAHPRPEAVS